MSLNFDRKTKKIFRQIALIIIAISSLISLVIFKISEKIYLYSLILIHKFKTACQCVQMAQFSMHPLVFISLGLLGVIIMTFVVSSVIKLFRIISQTNRFVKNYLEKAKFGHSSKLKRVMTYLNLNKNKVTEIDESKPVVFCYGLIRSKICISNGLVKLLRNDELEAVLLHEKHHMVSREPLKLFVIKYFRSIFFFVPGIKIFIRKYAIYSELAADEEATNNFNNKSKLARALFKISEKEEEQVPNRGLALSFFSSVISERVNTLSDHDYTPKFKLLSKGFFVSAFTIVISSALVFILLTDTSKAFEMHNMGSCALSAQTQHADQDCSMGVIKTQSCTKDNFQKISSYQPDCGMH